MSRFKYIIFPFFFLLALHPIFGFNIESFGPILFFVIALFFYSIKFNNEDYKFVLSASLFYLFSILTLFYSENLDYGVKEVLKGLSFILFPLSLVILKKYFTSNHITYFLRLYVLSLLLYGGYLIYHIVKVLELNNINAILLAFERSSFKYSLLGDIYKDIHPSYYSAGLIIGILICIENFFRDNKKSIKYFSLIFILFFIFLILILRSRTSLVALFLVTPIYLFLLLKSQIKRITLIVGTLCLLFISGIFFKQNQAYNKTVYNKIIIAKNLILNKGELDDNSKRSRIGIYEAALNIYKKNPVFGVGVGDVNDELRAEYISLGFEHFYKEKIYNSHNQYLHFALLGGVIGFLIFVSCLGYNLYFAIHNKDFLYMSFLLVFIIVILTENFLNRIHGIFFFAIFNSIFHYRSKYN